MFWSDTSNLEDETYVDWNSPPINDVQHDDIE